MSLRMRCLLARILLLLFLADIVGVGAVSAFADINDQHSPVAAESSGADGAHNDDGTASSGCNHACHFAQHFVAPTSQSPVSPLADVRSYAAPVHSADKVAGIRHKAPLHPPRALA